LKTSCHFLFIENKKQKQPSFYILFSIFYKQKQKTKVTPEKHLVFVTLVFENGAQKFDADGILYRCPNCKMESSISPISSL
jgi:hypothetical protein